MGLTSGAFQILSLLVGIAGIVATIWLWPYVASWRIQAVLARIGLVVISEVLVIVAFLVVLNGYFSFYTSWSQLLGSGAAQTYGFGAAKTAKPASALLIVNKAESAPLPGAPIRSVPWERPLAAGPNGVNLVEMNRGEKNLAQTGELLGITINGAHTGISVGGDYLYLPPQYFQPAYAHAKFPAVLVLTGYPASPWGLIDRLKVPGTSAALVAQNKIKPAVYVMMNSSVAMPRDFECTNVPASLQVETFFAQDVPLAIERGFRVESGPGSWAALGYSTGGLCAVKLAMLNPGQFDYAVSLAGYYTAVQDRTTGSLYGNSAGYRNLNSPVWRLANLPAPPVSVYVTSSRVGENTYKGTLAFMRLIRPPMRGYALILQQGGHNFGSWGRELPPSLIWLSQRLQSALPQVSGPPGTSAQRSAATTADHHRHSKSGKPTR
ncbi:MAG TPA: alpha/beta hydrolase-fold protein [Streptosporangiaceae bacterium]|nr:alpha/beta hydrolase-fold protein [Streptosporangiaceae bacterium]